MNDEQFLDFYKEPLLSRSMGIKCFSGLEGQTLCFPIHSLRKGTKCIILPCDIQDHDIDQENDIEFIVVPLLHQRLH